MTEDDLKRILRALDAGISSDIIADRHGLPKAVIDNVRVTRQLPDGNVYTKKEDKRYG